MRTLQTFLLLALVACSAFALTESDSDTDVSLNDSVSEVSGAEESQQEETPVGDASVEADEQQEASEASEADAQEEAAEQTNTFENDLDSESEAEDEEFSVADGDLSSLPDVAETLQLIMNSQFFKDDSMGYDSNDNYRASPGCKKSDFNRVFLTVGKLDPDVWKGLSKTQRDHWADCFISFATMRRQYKNQAGTFLFTRGSKGGFLFNRRGGGGFLFSRGENGGFLFTKKEGGGFLFSRGKNGGFLFTGKSGGFLFTRGDNAGFLFSHKSGHGFLFKKGAGILYGSKKGDYTYGGRKSSKTTDVDSLSAEQLQQYAQQALDQDSDSQTDSETEQDEEPQAEEQEDEQEQEQEQEQDEDEQVQQEESEESEDVAGVVDLSASE